MPENGGRTISHEPADCGTPVPGFPRFSVDASMDEFEAWMDYLFNRPLGVWEPAWYYDLTEEELPREWTLRYEGTDSPEAEAERIRRLFSDAGTLLRPYADEQVGNGLNVIVSGAMDASVASLVNPDVPSALRAEGLRSIVTLFAEVFAPRLAHPDWPPRTDGGKGSHPLDFICFMFWDICPFVPGRDDVTLEVLEATLALESDACQRSALHGLGHVDPPVLVKAAGIIDRWLRQHPDVPEQLRASLRSFGRGPIWPQTS